MLETKKQVQVETADYFKKRFLLASLKISMKAQNHLKQIDLGKSLDPTEHPGKFKIQINQQKQDFRKTYIAFLDKNVSWIVFIYCMFDCFYVLEYKTIVLTLR